MGIAVHSSKVSGAGWGTALPKEMTMVMSNKFTDESCSGRSVARSRWLLSTIVTAAQSAPVRRTPDIGGANHSDDTIYGIWRGRL
jgi:hypothetical protein